MIFTIIPLLRFLLPKHITAITLWPFVIFREKGFKHDAVIINHEKIHLRQQLELLIIPFYIIYLSEYVWGLLKYKNHNEAYRAISFEKEAYRNEKNMNYLEQRKPWTAWRTSK